MRSTGLKPLQGMRSSPSFLSCYKNLKKSLDRLSGVHKCFVQLLMCTSCVLLLGVLSVLVICTTKCTTRCTTRRTTWCTKMVGDGELETDRPDKQWRLEYMRVSASCT